MFGDHGNTYALLRAPGVVDFCVEALSAELPRSDYVRMKVAYCGLCGSDLAFYRGRPNAEYPRTLGHEHTGVVTQCGAKVDSVQVGDVVAVDPNYRCQSCSYCQSGLSHLCDFSEINLFTHRGFSNFVDLHASYLHKLPTHQPPFWGGLIEPLSCSLHALARAQVRTDDRILILGAGSQGCLLSFVLAVDFPQVPVEIYDPNHRRAENLAAAFENVTLLTQAPEEPQYSLIFEASGETRGFEEAILALQKSGRIVVLSRYRDASMLYFPFDFPRKEGAILFTHLNGNGEPFRRAIDLLHNRWSARYSSLIALRPLKDLEAVLRDHNQLPACKTIIAVGAEHER